MKNILFQAIGGEQWIGGLYHSANIIFSLLQNKAVTENYRIILATEESNIPLFRSFEKDIIIAPIRYNNILERKIKLTAICLKYHCSYVFHGFDNYYRFLGITMIRWIPDFQHNRLPQFFSDREIAIRTREYWKAAKGKEPLVLSSNDCLHDFQTFYSNEKNNIHVVPFVSYIEPIISSLTAEKENNILVKYQLDNLRYACVMNQFWQHKNHIVVFEAMQIYFKEHPDSDFLFVFTGKMSDYRNADYIDKLKRILDSPEISPHVCLLGFIEREEQIAIMKNAEYVIQPSLFEGWGTVVEDAKVLDKTILLSDIPVHREQKNDKCTLFDPNSPEQLAAFMERENQCEHHDSIDKGLARMYTEAKKYSRGFAELLGC